MSHTTTNWMYFKMNIHKKKKACWSPGMVPKARPESSPGPSELVTGGNLLLRTMIDVELGAMHVESDLNVPFEGDLWVFHLNTCMLSEV